MEDIKRTFIIGEEWLYYKIYCGNYSADSILVETINTILVELQNKKLIDYWFFVRYEDPKNHLRLRFHLSKIEAIQEVILIILPYFSKLIQEDVAYEINVGTYKREIERYGSYSIVESEKMFYYQSQKILKVITETPASNDEIVRIFVGLKNIDDLLGYFKISVAERQRYVQERSLCLRSEEGITKHNIRKISELYVKYKSDIFLFLHYHQEPKYLEGILKILESSSEEIHNTNTLVTKIKNSKMISDLNLVDSLIHMNINRLFRSRQRQYEMLCYEFMNKYYKTLMAKK